MPGTTDLAFIHSKHLATGKEVAAFARVISPERRVPLTLFGSELPISTIEPPRLQSLPVKVTIKNGHATYDAEELERVYGRTVPGLTKPGSSATSPTIVPGSGIEARDDEERSLIEILRARGAGAAQIQNALDAKRSGIQKPGARRNLPSVAKMSRELPNVSGPWLTKENGFSAAIPGQVARRLVGKRFQSFSDFRGKFWQEVAATPELAVHFNKLNQRRMTNGLAPFARRTQQVGKLRTYVLHHDPLISDWGDVIDMSTLTVMTPKTHISVHDTSRKGTSSVTLLSAKAKASWMSRDDAISTLNLLLSCQAGEMRDWELLDALEESFPHAGIGDLIYWTEPELTPEEVVDEALRREREWAAKN